MNPVARYARSTLSTFVPPRLKAWVIVFGVLGTPRCRRRRHKLLAHAFRRGKRKGKGIGARVACGRVGSRHAAFSTFALLVALIFTSAKGTAAETSARQSEIDRLLERGEVFLTPQVRKERQAIPLFQEAERLARAEGDRLRLGRALLGHAGALLSTHHYIEAESRMQEALRLGRSAGRYEIEQRALRLLGGMQIERGRFEQGIGFYTEMLESATKHADVAGIASAHNSLAATLRRQGDAVRAAESASRAVALIDRDPRARTPRLLFSAPYLRGRARLDLGEYPEALLDLHRALAAAETQQNIAGRWHCLNDIALWYQAQGDWQRAASYYRRALEVARLPDSRDLEGVSLRGMAEVEALRGRLGEAARAYEEALRIFTTNGIEGEVPLTRIGLAATRIDLGDLDGARSLLESAIEEGEKSHQPLAIARGRSELGRLHLLQKRYAEAESEYTTAVELTRRLGYVSLLPAALSGLADATRGRGDLQRARALYGESAGEIETLRSRIPGLEQRAAFAAMSHRTYEGLVSISLALHQATGDAHHLESAFAALERERSQNARAHATPASSNRERDRLEALLSRIQLQLAADDIPRDRRMILLDELDDAERQLTAIQGRSAEANPNALPRLGTLRQALRREEMFVSLAETSMGAFAFLVTTERLRVVKLPPLERLDARTEFFSEVLASNESQASLAAGQRLARELVVPWLAAMPAGTRRLIFSTSGAIARVPFAALPDPGRPSQPLLVRFEIQQAPSLTALEASRRLSAMRPRSGRALAVRFGTTSQRVAIGADSWELPALRSSAVELDALRRAADVHQNMQTPLETTNLREFDVLHFSAHAFLDPRIASRSAIVIGAPRGEDDGLLQTREISQLDLGGAAVVLASCQTAVGPASPAEGMYSLARAFGVAGASAVIATHWSVRDRASAEFFGRFYRSLARGDTMAAALRAAQIATMSNQPYTNTQDWAAFTVIGDGSIAPLSGARSRRTRTLMVGVVSVLLLALVLMWIGVIRSR